MYQHKQCQRPSTRWRKETVQINDTKAREGIGCKSNVSAQTEACQNIKRRWDATCSIVRQGAEGRSKEGKRDAIHLLGAVMTENLPSLNQNSRNEVAPKV